MQDRQTRADIVQAAMQLHSVDAHATQTLHTGSVRPVQLSLSITEPVQPVSSQTQASTVQQEPASTGGAHQLAASASATVQASYQTAECQQQTEQAWTSGAVSESVIDAAIIELQAPGAR